MTIRKTVLISIALSAFLFLSSGFLFTDCDSMNVQGYVKSCKDTLTCELEFFSMKLFPDSFEILSGDTAFTDSAKLIKRASLLNTLRIFYSDFDAETSLTSKEELVILKYKSFSDTLAYKKNQNNPSSYRFKRGGFEYITYFTNFVKYSEAEKNEK